MNTIENFKALLASGRDNALLRYALGNEYLKTGDAQQAAEHLEVAVGMDPEYSAAWKLLGKVRVELEQVQAAIEAYENGIAVADRKGDRQASKEMQVFLKRLQRREHGETE